MTATIPDPIAAAQVEVKRLTSDRHLCIHRPLERILADSPHVTREQLVQGLEAFHARRMAAIPSPSQYPESAPWVEYRLTLDRQVQSQANLTDLEMALYRSTHLYMTYHGFAQAARLRQPARDERCRVAYLPDSDVGQIHLKNVDDPPNDWKPEGRPTWIMAAGLDKTPLAMDGVGSGLHMDEEPAELFPLPAQQMALQHCQDVPSAVQFLTRYQLFWGGCNILLRDRQKRSIAIEKCSYNQMALHAPDAQGKSHISGMTCRDPQSTISKHQWAMRRRYMDSFGLPDDGPDNLFWLATLKFEQKLSAGLDALGAKPTFQAACDLFTTPWPQGLNKEGLRLHPQQGLIGYTLITYAHQLEKRKLYRWQRSGKPELKYPATPEIFEY